jgi:rubrerythrin
MKERTSSKWKKVCIVCGGVYTRQKGQSIRRCPICHAEYKANKYGYSNAHHRAMGHNTRGIHKKV